MTSSDAGGARLSGAAMAAFALALLPLTAACASSFERPAPVDLGPLRARAVTKIEDGIRASAAAPIVDEARSIFGIDLARIQPLWLEIENGSERVSYVLRLDPEYFAPRARRWREVAGQPKHPATRAQLFEGLNILCMNHGACQGHASRYGTVPGWEQVLPHVFFELACSADLHRKPEGHLEEPVCSGLTRLGERDGKV